MSLTAELQRTITHIATAGKGILAADESSATVTKRFGALNIPCTEDTRRRWRDLLITTPNISQFIAGVILYDETLHQNALDNTPFPQKLTQLGILPGIKVDLGLVNLPNTKEEQVTQGLDKLGERLAAYYEKGARFAKWRAVYTVSDILPTPLAIKANAGMLAHYAALCQQNGIVPIVEPEVLLEGSHSLEQCAIASENVLHALFHALHRHKVVLEHIILKPAMVISGKSASPRANVEAVARATVTILRRTVPAAVSTINFLSGGQTPEEATAHLNAMHTLGVALPWNLSYSYARALQDDAMKTWLGKTENVAAAQKAFYRRAKLNSLAATGKYTAAMETEGSVA